MSETTDMRISMVDGAYTLRDEQGVDVVTLMVGEHFEVQLRGVWCQVRLESGGYQGRYSITADGACGRLAVSMQARPCEHVSTQLHVEEALAASLKQARMAWVGKEVESRVPLAGGLVRGVVREITEQGQVVVVYTPRLNEVPVVVSFPVERVREVLTEACAAA